MQSIPVKDIPALVKCAVNQCLRAKIAKLMMLRALISLVHRESALNAASKRSKTDLVLWRRLIDYYIRKL